MKARNAVRAKILVEALDAFRELCRAAASGEHPHLSIDIGEASEAGMDIATGLVLDMATARLVLPAVETAIRQALADIGVEVET